MAAKAAIPTRQTADERRESILEAAIVEFGARGLHGTSTEDIARRAGISQPYVFRLFGTKKKLFAEACRRCMRGVHDAMGEAAAGRTGEEALGAMGKAYVDFLEENPNRLKLQMHMYAASDEPEIGKVARDGYGDLVRFVEATSGASLDQVARFFANGMLINVLASMDVARGVDWAQRLMEGCREEA